MSNPKEMREKHQAVVFKKQLGHYFIKDDGREIMCSVSSKLRKELIYGVSGPEALRREIIAVKDTKADLVAVGDRVIYHGADDSTGVITDVLPRKSCLERPDPGSGLELTIAANIDQIVAVFAAAKPEPKWGLLDRYLAFAEANGIPALVCITKMDLGDGRRIREETNLYGEIGYPVLYTSAETGEGIGEVRGALGNRISVLVGKSGVGKTSLLNTIQPGLGLRVNEISGSTGKGKHTTTHTEMFDLDFGGSIVDTPGIREFGLSLAHKGCSVANLFPEMRPYIGCCRFGMDCSHSHEPGCAVKEAVEKGEVAYRRFESYLRMQ